MRFMRGPSFATACFTYRLSRSTSRPFSVLRKFAVSIADCNSFATVAATRFSVKASVFRASSTRRPLIRFSTNRACCGATRMYLASARNSIISLAFSSQPEARGSKLFLCLRRRRRRWHYGSRTAGHARRFGRDLGRRFHLVPLELTGKAELAQFVPHHLRNNRRAPRPRPQHLLLVTRIHAFDFRRQVRIHERSFFCRSSHKSVLSSSYQPSAFSHQVKHVFLKADG